MAPSDPFGGPFSALDTPFVRKTLRVAFPLILGLAAISIFIGNWGYWFDPGSDFGRQLYVPWRLATGEKLYRDLYYMYGPLTPYLHSLLYRCFGVHVRTLTLFNELVFLGVLTMIYRLISSFSDRLTAFVCGLAVIGVSGFNQFMAVGSFNFITPYAYEATHGIFLSLAAYLAFSRYQDTGRRGFLAVSGMFMGLLFLGKMEIFLAAWLPLMVGLIKSRENGRAWLTLLLAAAGVVLSAVSLLSLGIPLKTAVHGILGGWDLFWNPRIVGDPFQRTVLGLADLKSNLTDIAAATAGTGIFFAALATGDRFLSNPRRLIWRYPAWLAVAAFLAATFQSIHWMGLAGILTPAVIAVVGVKLYSAFRGRSGRKDQKEMSLVFSLFALLLLSRIFFRPTFSHYGFFLAMPAMLLVVIGLCHGLPMAMKKGWGGGRFFRGAAVISIGFFVAAVFSIGQERYSRRPAPLSSNGETFYLKAVDAEVLNLAFREINTEIPPDATLTVTPSGEIFNFLSRRRSPGFHESLLPPSMKVYGEDRLREELIQAAPDYFLMINQDTSEYGNRSFGQDYARSIAAWVEGSYREVWTLGTAPFQGVEFGMRLMKRKN